MAKMGEGFENIAGKFGDSNYKMKDNTRYKSGDVTGVGIKKGSSVGAAVRETQSTSISGVGDEIRKQALMDFYSLPMKSLEASEKLEQLRYLEFGKRIKMVETNHVGIGIDTPEDLERARRLL